MAGMRLPSRPWDPAFMARSPAFGPLANPLARLDLAACPTPADLSRACRAGVPVPTSVTGQPICFIPHDSEDGLTYEGRIHSRGEVACHPGEWHDFLNALVWMTYPATKAALNARHIAEMELEIPAKRGRARDSITLFDEGGVIVCSEDPHMLDLIRTFMWKDLFWRQRKHFLKTTRLLVFGHALYQKMLDPFLGVTAMAILHAVEDGFMTLSLGEQIAFADRATARLLADQTFINTPQDLAPLPILGVPGWFGDNAQEGFYDNVAYFRPGRARSTRR